MNHTFQLEFAAPNPGSLERNFIGGTVVEYLFTNICFVVFSLFSLCSIIFTQASDISLSIQSMQQKLIFHL